MATNTPRRQSHLPKNSRPPSPSPCLIRSRSGTSPIALPTASTTSSSLKTSQRFMNRSHSTTRARSSTSLENELQVKHDQDQQRRNSDFGPQQGSVGKVYEYKTHMKHGTSPRNFIATKGVKSSNNALSAWALSPGRPSTSMTPPQSPGSAIARLKSTSGGSSSSVNGILKYFMQKKKFSAVDEENHQFKIMYNRFLQWRFVNAKAESSMNSLKVKTEEQLFSLWLRILQSRKIIGGNRIKVQKIQQDLRIYFIITEQLPLLQEWARLSRKNNEAVSRVTRKLSELSLRLPLVKGAQADLMSIYKAMDRAIGVMDSIEENIIKFLPKLDKILYLVTELTTMVEHRKEYFEEVEKIVALFQSLMTEETSMKAHLIRTLEESRRLEY